eukprot:112886_1
MMVAMWTVITCVLTFLLSHPSAQAQHEYDVIIMGAGASGIAAAKTLYEANITNILIIEAQWYIGGRAVVHYFSDYMLNIGASWISGACTDSSPNLNCSHYKETNPMLTAANKYNISFVITDWSDATVLDFGGTKHNQTDSNNRFNKFWDAQDCISNIMNNITKPEQMSYFAALYVCGWTKPFEAIDKTVQWYNYDFNAQHAKFSRIPNGEYENTHNAYGPNDLFITDRRGYQGIIKALANEFLDIDNINNESKIILNSPITTINYNENGVTVTVDPNDNNTNNTQYSAKYGIVTFPLGVLQSDIVEFIPKLPTWKIDALLGFDFIDYTPVLVKWPYDFWSDKVNDSQFILLNDDRFGFFTWVYNLDENVYNGSLIWRFDISLDLARTVQYQNINDTIRLIIDLKLSKYFDNIPEPDDILVASWNANKYVQGSYTFFPVGFEANHGKKVLQSPLGKLFFAGEVLNDYGYGMVHTAYLSGIRTANQILSCMGYDLEVTNGLECPSEYVPSDDSDCAMEDDSVFKDLVWLWIVLGLVFGIILGYLFAKYFNKKSSKGNSNFYGSVDDMNVPMVGQTTTTDQQRRIM